MWRTERERESAGYALAYKMMRDYAWPPPAKNHAASPGTYALYWRVDGIKVVVLFGDQAVIAAAGNTVGAHTSLDDTAVFLNSALRSGRVANARSPESPMEREYRIRRRGPVSGLSAEDADFLIDQLDAARQLAYALRMQAADRKTLPAFIGVVLGETNPHFQPL